MKKKEKPILEEKDISSVDLNTEMKKFLSSLESAKEIQTKTNSYLERIAIALEKQNNDNKILTPSVVEKLENLFQEHLHNENGESFFGIKQKEMMSEIEDIINIECYE